MNIAHAAVFFVFRMCYFIVWVLIKLDYGDIYDMTNFCKRVVF